MQEHKVVFTGGGTGGHIFPLISVIRQLKKIFPENQNLNTYYVAPQNALPNFDITQEGLEAKNIFAGKIRRYIDPKSIALNLLDLIKIPIGILQAFFYLFKISPDLVFSKGGYGSVPVTIAAKMLGIPVILHESDVIPGVANKLVAKLSTEVFVNFQETSGIEVGKKFVVGNPIRQELCNGDKKRGEERFNINSEKPVLLILGGSQGSERINDVILSVLIDLLEDLEVIHQCGHKHITKINSEVEAFISEDLRQYYHPYAFLDEGQMKDAYELADLVVSRAGAGTLAEITANKLPSILIPLPEAAQDHQTKNAYRISEKGASIVLEEDNLSPHFLLEKIKNLFSIEHQLTRMEEAAQTFAKPRAGEVLASYIKEYLIQ